MGSASQLETCIATYKQKLLAPKTNENPAVYASFAAAALFQRFTYSLPSLLLLGTLAA